MSYVLRLCYDCSSDFLTINDRIILVEYDRVSKSFNLACANENNFNLKLNGDPNTALKNTWLILYVC